jgi:hypothetical protein
VIAKNCWFISVTAKGQKETERVCDCKKVQYQIETVKNIYDCNNSMYTDAKKAMKQKRTGKDGCLTCAYH